MYVSSDVMIVYNLRLHFCYTCYSAVKFFGEGDLCISIGSHLQEKKMDDFSKRESKMLGVFNCLATREDFPFQNQPKSLLTTTIFMRTFRFKT